MCSCIWNKDKVDNVLIIMRTRAGEMCDIGDEESGTLYLQQL